MSQCPYYALLKISKQISWLPSINKTTRLFYQVFIDWLNFKKRSDSYHGDELIVCSVVVIICEASRMSIIYFTQSAQKDENFPLMQDFVTWLALQYN